MKFSDDVQKDIEAIEAMADDCLVFYKNKPYYADLKSVFCAAYLRGSSDAKLEYIKDVCGEVGEMLKSIEGWTSDKVDDEDLN